MTKAALSFLRPPKVVLVGIILLCSSIEALLTLSDMGFFGPARFRALVYEYAGFWPGLIGEWQPNYAIQPYLMFLSYAFLHGGLMHLIVNMFTLWSVGHVVVDRVGLVGFLVLYFGAIFGGALGYGFLAANVTPMVGASGALFGLIGGILAWVYVDRFNSNETLWPVGRAILGLIALNLILWWAMDGHLAWQTHLGGFIAGWLLALLVDPRPVKN